MEGNFILTDYKRQLICSLMRNGVIAALFHGEDQEVSFIDRLSKDEFCDSD